jgi:hypothetical protein
MKNLIGAVAILLISLLSNDLFAQGKQRDLDYWKPTDSRGVNVFEDPKTSKDSLNFDGLRVRVGGAFALQFQGLSHTNEATPLFSDPSDPTYNANELIAIGSDFNLATANLDLDVALARGVRLHLRTYLSSRHHTEAYVKGGYIQFDRFDFIKEGLFDNLMEIMSVRIGHMELNYGDQHFRRTDNGMALQNPFVGNYLMDAFTTEMAGEVYFQKNGKLLMLGISNGKLNQSVTSPGATNPAFYLKAGYDKQLSEDFRFRLTGSLYTVNHNTGSTNLYGGDRTGSRYYFVMENTRASASGNFRSGRIDPGFKNELTSVQFNTLLKFKRLELFGTFETSTGKNDALDADTRTWTQVAGDLIYRFGSKEQLYVGGRINTVSGPLAGQTTDVSVGRIAGVVGWYMTPNIMAKMEVLDQSYTDYATDNILYRGNFKGVMLEAVIAF